MNDRGSNPFLLTEILDLEKTIERLERRVEELKKDNETLIKEIDRLSEYNTNLERMMKK